MNFASLQCAGENETEMPEENKNWMLSNVGGVCESQTSQSECQRIDSGKDELIVCDVVWHCFCTAGNDAE